MAKKDKEFEARMQGMIYAYNIVKEGGMEALEKDLRKRNILSAPLKFTQKQMDEYFKFISDSIYNNMLTATCYALHESLGLGPKRLRDFKACYDKVVQDTLDLDYMGEHYIKLEDYAVEMNEKFNMGIDVSRVAMCQTAYDEKDPKYHALKIDRVARELRDNGFFDAAEFLEKKLA